MQLLNIPMCYNCHIHFNNIINFISYNHYNTLFNHIDKPSAPQGPIHIKEINSDSVTIEWKKPLDDGGLDISSYQVERCNVGKMIWSKVADIDHNVSAYAVQKLHEDSEYMFRVSAQNAVGTSEFLESEPVTVKCRYRKCINHKIFFYEI